jgi:hypothetical protein
MRETTVNRTGHAVVLGLLCGALLAGCYRPTQSAPPPESAAAAHEPIGVEHAIAGIYVDPANPNPCCWLAPDAEFETTVPANVKQLTLVVWAPADIPKLRREHQRITVTADGTSKIFSNISIGTTSLHFPVKTSGADRMVRMKMHMDLTFTPKEEVNLVDTRRLSIYLKSVQAI